ncbi:MAG: hypothetical protein KatS3mg125_0459 [Lysobacterales bacterium]|nr:MAG: hypothetical protein KatS3mg125_0459 [Xanthomonadales bacterium]
MKRTTFLSLCLAASIAPLAQGEPFHTIAPGIILEDARGRIYLMDRVGRTRALELGTGSVLWRSSEAAMPLGLLGDVLVALDGRKGLGGMRLLALDPRDGALRAERDVPMPTEIRARTRPGIADRFEMIAVPNGSSLELRWHYQRRSVRGAPAVNEESFAAAEVLSRAGAFSVSWDGAMMAIGENVNLPPDSAAFSIRIPAEALRTGQEAPLQRLSADGSTVMISEPGAPSGHGPVFRWRILGRDGSFLGELLSHYGSAPFVVREGLLLYRRNPLLLVGENGGLIEQGSRLIAWDLATASERWAVEVSELAYFGPAPP